MLRTIVSVAWLALAAGAAGAQDAPLSQPGPRFLLGTAGSARTVEIDPATAPIFQRRVTLSLERTTVGEALALVGKQAGLELVFSRDVINPDAPARLKVDGITAAAALTEILMGKRVDIVLSNRNRVTLTPRRRAVAPGAVTGRVTDGKTGDAVVNADVMLDGTRIRAATGEKGFYRIAEAEAGTYTLIVRRVGYAKQSRVVTVIAGQDVTVDVALQPIATQLNEIVTTVTGDQRRLELGHVVGVVNADSLVREAPVSNISELLTARVPGLQVFQSNGTVNGRVSLQIRGPNSALLNTEPIVVIDGVRYGTRAAPRYDCRYPFCVSGGESTSPLNDLNPNDVETIEVVKGPSAATLYGTDAANGVVVITTKRGTAGHPRWNAYARGTRSGISKQDYPDTYFGYGTLFGTPNSYCSLDYEANGYCTQDSVARIPTPLNDSRTTLFGHAPRYEGGMSVTGGSSELSYFFAGDYESAIGPIKTPEFLLDRLRESRGTEDLPEQYKHPNTADKLNLRANIAAGVGSTADVRVNAGYIRGKTRSLSGSAYYSSIANVPGMPYGSSYPEQMFSTNSMEGTDRFVGSSNAQWRPASWLVARATVGLDLNTRNRNSLTKRGESANGPSFTGSIQDERARMTATTAELGATATARKGRLTSRTSVGAQYVRNLSDGLTAVGIDLPPGGTSVGEGAQSKSVQLYSETVTLGSYVEETIGFNERLFLTGALRVDGASAFGQDYDAAAYPKISVSWLTSAEPFMPRIPGLDELRLRYAYGASGQQPNAGWAQPRFFTLQVAAGGTIVTVPQGVSLGNPNLRPERVREHEFGFDATALNNRLQVGLTWYQRKTVDQIVQLDLAPGLGDIYTNLGLTSQHGFEAELGLQVVDARAIGWDIRFQHGLHRTKLERVGNGVERFEENSSLVEGYPLGARFGRRLTGYADANGDGIIASDEVQLTATPVYQGESTPPISQTLTNIVSLFDRRVRLSALFERRSGYTQVNYLLASQCGNGMCRARTDRTTPLGEQALAAAVASYQTTYFESAAFTRLREVSVALDLPNVMARALRLRTATMSLTGRNLALWTDFRGTDPESAYVNGIDGGNAQGVPQGTSWTARFDLGF